MATAASFNLGTIEHTLFGKATIAGELQFVLPPGKYQPPTILNEPDRLKNVVTKVFPTCREIWPDLLDEEIKEKVKEFAVATAFVIPRDLEDERSRIILFSHIFRSAITDLVNSDILEDPELQAEDGGPAMTYKDLLDRVKGAEMSNEGMENAIDEIPAVLPEITNIKNFITKLYAQMKTLVPEALDKISYGSRVAFVQDISAIVIFREMEQKGQHYSQASRLEFDRHMQAMKSQMEFNAVCFDIHLSPDIRSDVLFLTLMNNFVDIVMIVNSILELPKTLQTGEDVGPIMHLVLQQKLTLAEAFTEVYCWLKEMYHDYKLTVDKLYEVYGEDENLIKYIELVGYFLDGSTHRYLATKQWALNMN